MGFVPEKGDRTVEREEYGTNKLTAEELRRTRTEIDELEYELRQKEDEVRALTAEPDYDINRWAELDEKIKLIKSVLVAKKKLLDDIEE